jgi:hypothetical protein
MSLEDSILAKNSNVEIATVLKRHLNFWEKGPTKRPLIGIPWWGVQNMDQKIGLQLGILTPEKLDPGIFLDAYEESFHENGLFEGDYLKVASAFYYPRSVLSEASSIKYFGVPTFVIPWAEAIFGCQIEVKSSGIWAKPHEEGKEEPSTVESLFEDIWFKKALEITNELNKKFVGNYPTAAPMLRGPADMVAALLGAEKMCIDLMTDPDKVQGLLRSATDIWLSANSKFQETSVKFHNGYSLPRFQIWSPSYIAATQEDCSLFFSPERYSVYLYKVNQRVTASSPHTIMHIHSSGMHVIDSLISINALGALEIVLEKTGPTLTELMPTLIKIQKDKPLILYREFDKQDLEVIFEYLRPEGLSINAVPGTSEEALALLRLMIENDR